MPAPAKPATPEVARATPNTLLVRRDAFAVANPAVATWEVRYRTAADTSVAPNRVAGGYQSLTGIDDDVLVATLADLRPDYLYDVSIRAVNTDGNSTWSDTVQARTQLEDTMGNLVVDLTEVQAGLEAANSAGTLVAATRKLPFITAAFTPEITREELVERGTVRAATTDVVTGKGAQLVLEEHLSIETLLLPLLCGWARVNSAAFNSARRWVFTPSVVAPSGLATATFEVAATDGTTDNYRGRFGFARPTALSVVADGASTAKLNTTWMGRAEQTLGAAAGVSAPARWFVPARLLTLAIDDAWGSRGNTMLGKIRSMTLTPDPGLVAEAALEGRSDFDATHWLRNRLAGTVQFTVDHDGDSGAELGHWKDGDLRYFRIEATNGASNAALRRLRWDLVGRYIESPDVLGADGDQHVLSLNAELRADSANNFMSVEIINALTSW